MIFHIHSKKRDFTQIDNSILRNPELSLKAKGLLALLLTFPADFNPALKLVVDSSIDGLTSVRTGLKELRRHGHADLRKPKDAFGRFSSSYAIYEDPAENPTFVGKRPKKTGCRNSDCGKPDSGESADIRTIDVNLGEGQPFHWGRTFEDWKDALDQRGLKPRKVGNGWVALCPCHLDTKPSLTFRAGVKRAVVAYCHSGCDFEAIAEFLFPGPWQASTVYTYCNSKDEPQFRVIRDAESKGFVTQSLVEGRWVSGLREGVQVVPYRLPNLISAVRKKETIWIVEGEKDAESFRRKGLPATCNPFGAGKWRPDFNQYFKSAKVVVVADKDNSGRKHGLDVYEHLLPVAHSVRLVQAAGGNEVNDSTDHFEQGFGTHQFVEISIEEFRGAL